MTAKFPQNYELPLPASDGDRPQGQISRLATVLIVCIFAATSSQAQKLSLDQQVENLGAPSSLSQIQAEEAILESTQAALGPLIRGLSHKNAWVRQKSLDLLLQIEPRAATDEIVSHSQSDPNTTMRSSSIRALPCLGRPSLSEVARQQARASGHPAIRRAAIMTVAKMEGTKALGWLEERLSDLPTSVAARAALELAVLGSTAGYAFALRGLDDSDRATRIDSASALFHLALPESAPALKRASENVAAGIGSRSEALQALKRIELLGIPPAQRVQTLHTELASDSDAIRAWAAHELRRIGTPEAKAVLVEAVQSETHPGRQQAAVALEIAAESGLPDNCRK